MTDANKVLHFTSLYAPKVRTDVERNRFAEMRTVERFFVGANGIA